MTAKLIEVRGVDLDTASGRALIRGLTLSFARGDRAALIGRNGVGKSSLLELLAGQRAPERGRVVGADRGRLVPQRLIQAQRMEILDELEHHRPDRLERELGAAGLPSLEALRERVALSGGELRKLALLAAKLSAAPLLLLDEPDSELDEQGLEWLRSWLERWSGALLISSHSPRLLTGFEHFFVVAESGCRHFAGSLDALEASLAHEQRREQERHLARLDELARAQRRHVKILRRRERKKNLGRMHELGRGTSRAWLNTKRGYAQESQARAAGIRAQRMAAVRSWAHASRRALSVELPLETLMPELPPARGQALVRLEQVGLRRGGRSLFTGLSLAIERERFALRGPNGSGKSSLLQLLSGALGPTSGRAGIEAEARARIGVIEQGGANWLGEESLIERLRDEGGVGDPDEVAALVHAHGFPLALAARPLASLSPGERVRAALICLMRQRPQVELLLLDEPTYSLDLLARRALAKALRVWPGGLVIASHDTDFLAQLQLDAELCLG